jgi:hypothetical protein
VRIVPSHVVLNPPRIAAKIKQALQSALLNDIPIEVAYQLLQGSAPTPRILYPSALLLRGSSLYLIAHQKDAGETALRFAVQRFSTVRLRELEPWPTADFSLNEFLADGKGQFGEGTLMDLEATISPRSMRLYGRRSSHETEFTEYSGILFRANGGVDSISQPERQQARTCTGRQRRDLGSCSLPDL